MTEVKTVHGETFLGRIIFRGVSLTVLVDDTGRQVKIPTRWVKK